MSEPTNLAEALLEELKRNRELLAIYKEIGPAGTFAYTMVSKDIDDANKAMIEGDVVSMIQCYETLKNNQ